MKPTNTRAHTNTAYNIATGVTTDTEEGLDQLSGLPSQLLASKGVRISGTYSCVVTTLECLYTHVY